MVDGVLILKPDMIGQDAKGLTQRLPNSYAQENDE